MPTFTAADGTPIHYEEHGEGLPLLCLHGLTRNSRDFDYVAPHLKDVWMIRMDYRGRGQSGWSGAATYTIPQEAEDALGLLDHLGIPQAAILGTSRGGLIAMFLAATAPERLLGALLNDVGPVLNPKGMEAIMGYLGRNPPFATVEDAARARMAADRDFPGLPFDRWLTDVAHTHEETPEGLRINYDPALRDAVAASLAQGPADAWPLFDALRDVPVALLHAENSNLMSDDIAGQMRRRNPDMIYQKIPDRGHVPFLDEPDSLRAIRKWLKQVQA